MLSHNRFGKNNRLMYSIRIYYSLRKYILTPFYPIVEIILYQIHHVFIFIK